MLRALALARTISGASGMTWTVSLSFSQAAVYAFCKYRHQKNKWMTHVNKSIYILWSCTVHVKMLYLVHDLIVGSSQSQVHGVHQLAELKVGWMSAVLLVTLNLTTNFSGLNCKWANWDPSSTSDIVVPFRLVITLKRNVRSHESRNHITIINCYLPL